MDLPRLETGLIVTKKQLSSARFQSSVFTFLFYNKMPEAAAYQNLHEKQVITGVVILKTIFEREKQFIDTNLLEFWYALQKTVI